VHEEPPPGLTFTVLARSDADPDFLLPALITALRVADPGVPVYEAGSLRQRLHGVLAQPRFYTAAILTLAVLALLLALAGTYATASHAVASRAKEIGVRIALGSTAAGVRNLFLRSSLLPVAIGAALGIAGAWALGPMLAHWIPNVDPVDVRACVAAGFVLAGAAVSAAWIATSRVTREDPMAALRTDC
jgi:putative ABC transport system permease protein